MPRKTMKTGPREGRGERWWTGFSDKATRFLSVSYDSLKAIIDPWRELVKQSICQNYGESEEIRRKAGKARGRAN
jgi:hypothetical protein